MPLDLSTDPLPGVGVRYSFATAHGGRLAIVDREDGLFELYYFAQDGDEEPRVVIRLETDEARQAGAVMGGAYRRPALVNELEIALGELVIEWDRVPADSPLAGRTIGEERIRTRTGVTVLAIVRGNEPVFGAQPEDAIQPGDVLVTVGRVEQYDGFRRLLAG
ncbi:MAG TPA: TrkA C-terminal domain-containing protein [Gaiellaceae bacterium]|nr:TrkA C-terminal domain-containing protein [Gaiellaceae bacterium]